MILEGKNESEEDHQANTWNKNKENKIIEEMRAKKLNKTRANNRTKRELNKLFQILARQPDTRIKPTNHSTWEKYY